MFKKVITALSFALLTPTVFATPINASLTGIPSAINTITFDEVVLTTNSAVTTQYAGLGVTFSPSVFYTPQSGFPNIVGNAIGNFGDGYTPQFSIIFSAPQTNASFAFVSNGTVWNFDALLGNTIVESFSAEVSFNSAADFFGFTGITFDSITLTSASQDFALLDTLQFGEIGTVPPSGNVPEPASLLLLSAGIIGLQLMLRHKKSS